MYLEDGLSASQMAEALGVSKSHIISRLHKVGISNGKKGRMTNPANYRHYNPSYGWKVKDGVLIPSKAELKICRLVVTLKRNGMGYRAIAKELVKRKIKNRNGFVAWGHFTVTNIYKSWKEKL